MATKKKLGELLLDAELITQEQLDEALKLQVRGGTRQLGYLLIKLGFISEEQLQSVLSDQLGLPIIDVHEKFNPEVKKILPRYLCNKYNVLPLSLGKHNKLEIAMADPSDSRAVEDIEQYTKKVLQTFLAPNSAIGIAIKKYIPWSFKDLISPQNTLKLTAVTATVALVLIAVTIVQYNNDRLRTLYGTKQDKRDVVSYQNYELILDFHKFGEKSGKVSLLGHGAHAQGSYSITFNDTGSLEQFINRKHNDFSEAQRTWLSWAMDNQTAR